MSKSKDKLPHILSKQILEDDTEGTQYGDGKIDSPDNKLQKNQFSVENLANQD